MFNLSFGAGSRLWSQTHYVPVPPSPGIAGLITTELERCLGGTQGLCSLTVPLCLDKPAGKRTQQEDSTLGMPPPMHPNLILGYVIRPLFRMPVWMWAGVPVPSGMGRGFRIVDIHSHIFAKHLVLLMLFPLLARYFPGSQRR